MMKKRIVGLLAMAAGIALLCGVCSLLCFAGQCEDISDRVIRLHILAESDSEADQAVKLAVRDRLLKEAAARLNPDALTKEAAEAELTALLPELTTIAEDELRRQGSNAPVTLSLADTFFTTRTYGEYTLPAGRYEALRVVIGSGEGHNWWCIVFPPLCISACTEDESPSAKLDAVLNEDEMQIVSDYPHYELRFKLLEWFQTLREKWVSH